MSKVKDLRNRVLLALYRDEPLPTRRNDVLSALCRAHLIEVTERRGYIATKARLTEGGYAYVRVVLRAKEDE